MKKEEEIRVCNRCDDYGETPLIWTFAFNGAEYWCPACGATYGMLGAGKMVPCTTTLKSRLAEDQKASKVYLRARGTLICAQTKYKGEWVSPRDLPENVLNKLKEKATSWKYRVKNT